MLEKLESISPYEFEDLIGQLWERQGWETTVRRGSRDKGIDVVGQKNNKKALIQAKRFGQENKVSSGAVRNYATLYQQEEDADQVIIITTSSFTKPALELGQDLDVRTIGGLELVRLLQKHDAIDVVEQYTNSRIKRRKSKRKTQSKSPGRTNQKEERRTRRASRPSRASRSQPSEPTKPADDSIVHLKIVNQRGILIKDATVELCTEMTTKMVSSRDDRALRIRFPENSSELQTIIHHPRYRTVGGTLDRSRNKYFRVELTRRSLWDRIKNRFKTSVGLVEILTSDET